MITRQAVAKASQRASTACCAAGSRRANSSGEGTASRASTCSTSGASPSGRRGSSNTSRPKAYRSDGASRCAVLGGAPGTCRVMRWKPAESTDSTHGPGGHAPERGCRLSRMPSGARPNALSRDGSKARGAAPVAATHSPRRARPPSAGPASTLAHGNSRTSSQTARRRRRDAVLQPWRHGRRNRGKDIDRPGRRGASGAPAS